MINPEFLENIRNKSSTYVMDVDSTSSTMVIVFSGMGGGLGIPFFEFFTMLSQFDIKTIFLRDATKCWYQHGLPQIGGGVDGGVDDIAAFLGHQIDEHKPTRIVTIGNSAGGYAALLFGILLCVDTVITFSPRTYLGPWKRLFTGDIKHFIKLFRLTRQGQLNKKYLNLRSLCLSRECLPEFHLFYSRFNWFDRLHIQHLSHLGNISVYPHDYRSHHLVKHLKETGELEGILHRFLSDAQID